MTTLTVRGLDDDTRGRLRVRPARNGRSMEAEIRAILREALSEADAETGLAAGSSLPWQSR
jgi:antitoxin FitA